MECFEHGQICTEETLLRQRGDNAGERPARVWRAPRELGQESQQRDDWVEVTETKISKKYTLENTPACFTVRQAWGWDGEERDTLGTAPCSRCPCQGGWCRSSLREPETWCYMGCDRGFGHLNFEMSGRPEVQVLTGGCARDSVADLNGRRERVNQRKTQL